MQPEQPLEPKSIPTRRDLRAIHGLDQGNNMAPNNGRGQRSSRVRGGLASLLRYIKDDYLGIVAIAAVIAGTLQNPFLVSGVDLEVETWNQSTDRLWSISSSPIYRYVDDALVVLLFMLSLIRWRGLRAWPMYAVALWGAVLTASVIVSIFVTQAVSTENSFFLYRQVVMPAMLLVPAFVLKRREWFTFIWWSVGVAVLNAVYAVFEFFGVRIFSPASMAILDGRWVDKETGLPGNFLGWWVTGDVVERLGGLVLNPPTVGVLVATAAVLTLWTANNPFLRYGLVALFVLISVGSISRGGWVLLIAGIAFPYLVRIVGAWVSSGLIAMVALVAGIEMMSHGGSGLHLNGLVGGIEDGIMHPFGRGFGWAGNYAEKAESEESLLGIAFSAGGVIPILLVLLLVCYLLLQVLRGNKMWLSALSLGALAVAALAETAGSIYGTIPLWIAVGMALRKDDGEVSSFPNGPSKWLDTHGLWGRQVKEKK